ncbi:guanylate cyclase [Gordonibacter sp. 28C]|uniref:guanylate cyclase n=1 Tax=Gordonibacter sp. 28C TaxID=2078569 RepID=UPI000DF866BC|nr:guanylate cyclase [Gordonibacter sp. 28C]RDB59716.1 guanylate cyclase [Gordonibacter sp. 28C]
MIARLSRIVPLLIVLAVVAAIVYLVAAWRYSPNRGKEILIKAFTWLTGVLSGIFALISLYALIDGNELILDLGLSFLVAALVGLAITRICRAVFVRNHPGWKKKPMKTTRPDDHPRRPFTPPWKR